MPSLEEYVLVAQDKPEVTLHRRSEKWTPEVVAAVGLTLPGLTRIQPWLVPSAAVGIMIVMVSATIYHLSRGEVSSAATTIVLLVMATYVAYMRWKVKPILPRTVA